MSNKITTFKGKGKNVIGLRYHRILRKRPYPKTIKKQKPKEKVPIKKPVKKVPLPPEFDRIVEHAKLQLEIGELPPEITNQLQEHINGIYEAAEQDRKRLQGSGEASLKGILSDFRTLIKAENFETEELGSLHDYYLYIQYDEDDDVVIYNITFGGPFTEFHIHPDKSVTFHYRWGSYDYKITLNETDASLVREVVSWETPYNSMPPKFKWLEAS